jgi:WD40 repeat protein
MAAGHTDAIRALAGHGRTMITASYDRSVRVWDVTDGTCKKVLMGHTDKGTTIALYSVASADMQCIASRTTITANEQSRVTATTLSASGTLSLANAYTS